MKTAITVALAAALLTGCSSSRSADTVDNVQQSFQQSTTAPAVTSEDLYLEGVKANNNPDLMDETDQSLLDVGHQTCDILDQGYTVETLVNYLLTDNPTDAQIKYESIIIGNAIKYLCPQYLDQINA